MLSRFKSSTTHWCITLREKVEIQLYLLFFSCQICRRWNSSTREEDGSWGGNETRNNSRFIWQWGTYKILYFCGVRIKILYFCGVRIRILYFYDMKHHFNDKKKHQSKTQFKVNWETKLKELRHSILAGFLTKYYWVMTGNY